MDIKPLQVKMMIFFECCVDIRDLISIEDVMEELGYGPNGGLVYCME